MILGEKNKKEKKAQEEMPLKQTLCIFRFCWLGKQRAGPRLGGPLAPVGWFQALEQPQHAWHLVNVSPGLCNSAHRYFGVLKYFSTFFFS